MAIDCRFFKWQKGWLSWFMFYTKEKKITICPNGQMVQNTNAQKSSLKIYHNLTVYKNTKYKNKIKPNTKFDKKNLIRVFCEFQLIFTSTYKHELYLVLIETKCGKHIKKQLVYILRISQQAFHQGNKYINPNLCRWHSRDGVCKSFIFFKFKKNGMDIADQNERMAFIFGGTHFAKQTLIQRFQSKLLQEIADALRPQLYYPGRLINVRDVICQYC